jgi:hypothetical protein
MVVLNRKKDKNHNSMNRLLILFLACVIRRTDPVIMLYRFRPASDGAEAFG